MVSIDNLPHKIAKQDTRQDTTHIIIIRFCYELCQKESNLMFKIANQKIDQDVEIVVFDFDLMNMHLLSIHVMCQIQSVISHSITYVQQPICY